MNKKAFVLMETIVVIVVISVALLTIFKSYNKILSKVKTENKYDTSEYIYMTNYVKKYLKDKCNSNVSSNIFNLSSSTSNPIDFFTNPGESCSFSNNPFNIKKIHVIKLGNGNIEDNLKKFDAYMIDYIRKLDVRYDDKVIVVEYNRPSLDNKGEPKTEYGKTTQLNETYIASLEWD